MSTNSMPDRQPLTMAGKDISRRCNPHLPGQLRPHFGCSTTRSFADLQPRLPACWRTRPARSADCLVAAFALMADPARCALAGDHPTLAALIHTGQEPNVLPS